MHSPFAPSDDPLDITLLVLAEVSLLSLAATLEPLRAANRAAGRTHYRWKLVSPDGEPVVTSSGLNLPVQSRFRSDKVDGMLIVLAAFNADQHATGALLAELRKTAQRGIPTGGVESGSWLLARAGLLDGRRATTHWEDLDRFASAFPNIDVRPDRFVIDGNRFSTGGASPALDMILYLIRQRQGNALALNVASIFIYEKVRRAADPQQTVSVGRIRWNEPRVTAAIQIMEAHIEHPVSIVDIASEVGIKVRMLEIVFKRVIGASPSNWYLKMRLNEGRRFVIDTRLSITEIAMRTGFSSSSAFARQFRAAYSESPELARKRALITDL